MGCGGSILELNFMGNYLIGFVESTRQIRNYSLSICIFTITPSPH